MFDPCKILIGTDFALDFLFVRFLSVKIPAGILKWMHPFVLGRILSCLLVWGFINDISIVSKLISWWESPLQCLPIRGPGRCAQFWPLEHINMHRSSKTKKHWDKSHGPKTNHHLHFVLKPTHCESFPNGFHEPCNSRLHVLLSFQHTIVVFPIFGIWQVACFKTRGFHFLVNVPNSHFHTITI